MNYIKNLINSIMNFFVGLHDVTRDATVSVANAGFKAAGLKKSIIALTFWVVLAVILFFGFKTAFAYLALETVSGFTMYVIVRTATTVFGMFTALYMFGMFNKPRLV